MSAWRLAIRTLYTLGGQATTAEIAGVTIDCPKSALRQLIRLQMVEHDPAPKGTPVLWRITERGLQWCEGRIDIVPMTERKTGGRSVMRFAATWLMSLPQGVRIGAEAPEGEPA